MQKFVVAFAYFVNTYAADDWSYHDIDAWVENFEFCAGEAQSPVDIPPPEAFVIPSFMQKPLFSFNYENAGSDLELQNNGHSVVIDFSAQEMSLNDGDLIPLLVSRSADDNNGYKLANAHFHWGLTEETGSEHTVAGHQYPMEMHLVHFNQFKYETGDEASLQPDGLLVVAVFFEVDDENNQNELLDPLLGALQQEEYFTNATSSVADFSMASLVAGLNTESFYIYPGSLTTPTCNEAVTWVILKDTLKISAETLAAFQTTSSEESELIAPNFRPVQNGNARPVYDSDKNSFGVLGTAEVQTTFNYTYFAKDMWTEDFETCAGESQSPVNLPPFSQFEFARSFSLARPSIELNYDFDLHEIEFENRGGTVEIALHGQGLTVSNVNNLLPAIGKEFVEDTLFHLEQIHFHWGLNENRGSEHLVDGKSFPIEMHLVHSNEGRYGELNEAQNHADGLLVVAVFIEASDIFSEATEDALRPIAEVIENKQTSFLGGAAEHLESLNVQHILEPLDTSRFYSYPGSLTTPPCSEVVSWVIMKDTLKVSHEFLEALQGVEKAFGVPIGDNFRHTQDGNGRLVYDSSIDAFAFIKEGISSGNMASLSTVWLWNILFMWYFLH